MIKRIVEVAQASYISLKDRQLRIEQRDELVASVPVEDIGILILAHPGNTITQQALVACETSGAAVVVCGETFLPEALLLPFDASTLHAEVLRLQIAATERVKGSLWRQIVVAKIDAQADLLRAIGQPSARLGRLALHVQDHDTGNLEAQAASLYWKTLFGKSFRRNPDTPGLNAFLNYGYSVLRSAVARAVVGTGLHPALGLFHSHRNNAFALADDLMEPLRPAVDALAYQRLDVIGTVLTPALRRDCLGLLGAIVQLGAKDVRLPLWVALQRYAAAFKESLGGGKVDLEVPRWQFSGGTEPCGSL